jgi:hypothetical protein
VLALVLAACGGGGETLVGAGGGEGVDASAPETSVVTETTAGPADAVKLPRPEGVTAFPLSAGAAPKGAAYLSRAARLAIAALAARHGRGAIRVPDGLPTKLGPWTAELSYAVVAADGVGVVWEGKTYHVAYSARLTTSPAGATDEELAAWRGSYEHESAQASRCDGAGVGETRRVDIWDATPVRIGAAITGCELRLDGEGTHTTWLYWRDGPYLHYLRQEPNVLTREELVDMAASVVPIE